MHTYLYYCTFCRRWIARTAARRKFSSTWCSLHTYIGLMIDTTKSRSGADQLHCNLRLVLRLVRCHRNTKQNSHLRPYLRPKWHVHICNSAEKYARLPRMLQRKSWFGETNLFRLMPHEMSSLPALHLYSISATLLHPKNNSVHNHSLHRPATLVSSVIYTSPAVQKFIQATQVHSAWPSLDGYRCGEYWWSFLPLLGRNAEFCWHTGVQWRRKEFKSRGHTSGA